MLGNKRTLDERVDMVKLYYQERSVRRAQQNWRTDDPPSLNTILATVHRFESTGRVDDLPRSGRERSILSEAGLTAIKNSIQQKPELSIEARSTELGISWSSCQRGIAELGFHPYRMHIHQQLKAKDMQERLVFANWWLDNVEENPEFIDKIWFSDECEFTLDRTVTAYNCYYYALENPHYTLERPMTRGKTMAWCAIGQRGIIGPYFFKENVNQVSYKQMLINMFFKNVTEYHGEEPYYFQQDGAAPHRAEIVKNYLNGKLPGHWIGKGGPINWPARSPDLTPPDFFLWGYLRERVYRRNPLTVAQLQLAIREETMNIELETCCRVLENVTKRMEKVVEQDGGHVEF